MKIELIPIFVLDSYAQIEKNPKAILDWYVKKDIANQCW